MKLTKLLFSLLAVNQCEASTGAVKKTARRYQEVDTTGEVVWNVLAAFNPLVTVGLLANRYLGLNTLTYWASTLCPRGASITMINSTTDDQYQAKILEYELEDKKLQHEAKETSKQYENEEKKRQHEYELKSIQYGRNKTYK